MGATMRDEPMQLTKRANINIRSSASNASDASPVDKTQRTSAMILFRILAVSLLAVGVANCSSASRSGGGSAKVDPKYGVKPSPRVVSNGTKVPKGGGRAMVGKPYVVAGKTFTPRETDDYVAVGTASWYGADFHGRKTANGEIFDKQSIAAAHPTLPLPSYVRVTNLSNQRSMVVRVNDRGPFHGNRLIDLSKGAAEALDFHRQGTARVKVEYVGRASLNGSDDRKLLATLQDGAPAPLPVLAPAPVIQPVQAPVMVASVEPVPVESVVEAPVSASDVPPVAETLPIAAEKQPEQATPIQIATLQKPVAASMAPPSRAMLYTQAADTAELGGLNELVREVSEAPAEAHDAIVAMPLPPSRPVDGAGKRHLIAPVAEALHTQASAPRSLVASLPFSEAKNAGKNDPAGAFFEPMPISQLTPQRFISIGKNTGR